VLLLLKAQPSRAVQAVFIPSPNSCVRRLDQEMREDLAASLERLAGRAAAVLPRDVDMEAASRDIRAHRVGPGVFAAYYDLIHALQAEALDHAAVCWRGVAAAAAETVRLECRPYDPLCLGEDAARFQRLFAMGWQAPAMFAPPDKAGWSRFRGNVDDALSLLSAVAPSWRAEVESLVSRIFAALPPPGEGRRFAGASCFMAWGAVFLNVRRNDDRLRVLAGLVHEATHQMLFGLSRRQPLTENPPDRRYASPLRRDPRPMDGVYHATYVSGRLGALYELLSRHDGLDVSERTTVVERIARQKRRFAEGYAVVRREGRLTALGRDLIEAAAENVAGALPA
jgi:HEXXH motif-containing protein